MSLYVNPVLSEIDMGFARIGGPGLANCMFFTARAVVIAKRLNGCLMRPTWERLGLGQWVRRERDKRLYRGLFKHGAEIEGIRKGLLLRVKRHINEGDAKANGDGVVMVRGLKGFFSVLWDDADIIRQYFRDNILPAALIKVPADMSGEIAVHVRLGDYPSHWRTDIGWYVKAVNVVRAVYQKRNEMPLFRLFSDGSDEELEPLLSINGVERAFYGNALADMVAISRCHLLIGSDSTFSGWGAFLGNVPCMFAHVHYGRPVADASRVLISDDMSEMENWIAALRT